MASAQTLAWDGPANASSAVQAETLEYRLYVNNGTPVTLTNVVCTGTTAPHQCQAPLPANTPTSIDTRIELTAKSALSAESVKSPPFFIGPTAPTRLRSGSAP